MKAGILIYLFFSAFVVANLLPTDYICEWTWNGWHCHYKATTTTITTTVGGKPTTITKTIKPTTSVYTTTSCYYQYPVQSKLPMSILPSYSCGPGYNGPACYIVGMTLTTTMSGTPTTFATTVYPSYTDITSTICQPTVVTTIIRQ